MPGHDIIVIGGSAGAVEVLRHIVGSLPADLPASLFVAIHQTPYTASALPQVLTDAGRLPAKHPSDREPIRPATIYVAPPDHHLLIGGDVVRIVQGPREHHTRPAIDPLFRSAALWYGPRVVGVVLSGLLDDGAAGLAAIDARKGVAIVHDPVEAEFPEMPARAVRGVPAALSLRAATIGPTLVRLALEAAAEPVEPAPRQLEWEVAVAAWDLEALASGERPGAPSPFSCPDCGGDLWEYESDGLPRFRCRVGHGFSPLTLLAGQSHGIDDVLNEAFRALKEKEHLQRRLAKLAAEGRGLAYHESQAEKAAGAAAAILHLLLDVRAVNDAETGPDLAGPTGPGAAG